MARVAAEAAVCALASMRATILASSSAAANSSSAAANSSSSCCSAHGSGMVQQTWQKNAALPAGNTSSSIRSSGNRNRPIGSRRLGPSLLGAWQSTTAASAAAVAAAEAGARATRMQLDSSSSSQARLMTATAVAAPARSKGTLDVREQQLGTGSRGGDSSSGGPTGEANSWQAPSAGGGWLSRNPDLEHRIQDVLQQAAQLQAAPDPAAPAPLAAILPAARQPQGRRPMLEQQSAEAAEVPLALPPLPVPNLGYACLNTVLRRRRGAAAVSTNRSCRRRTFEGRGLAHVSALALANCRDLLEILRWNAVHGIRFYRISSGLLPWALGGEYKLRQLPDYESIAAALTEAGTLAQASGQRLTAHPPHYVKLASRDEGLVDRSIALLEMQSEVFDLMGFEPSPWNKLNIHVGGTYGSKRAALRRFAAAVGRLSPAAAARLTVENDDRPNSYSVADLLPLSAETGVPITFDAHHHRFCSGGLPRREALEAALATWPRGVRPVVHWSEPPECPLRARVRPHAHSAFVFGPISLHGYEAEVDVMIESKAAEQALLLYRDRLQPLHEAGLLPGGKWEEQLAEEPEPAPHELAAVRAMAAAAIARAAALQELVL